MLRLHLLICRRLCRCLSFALVVQLLVEAKAAAASKPESDREVKPGTTDPDALTPAESWRSEAISVHQESLSYLPQPRRDWILSLEAVTHAPIDIGCQAFLEVPFRARLAVGLGWIPSAYSSLLTGIAASASGDALATAILNHASYGGQTFRVQGGFRPFPLLGLYAEFGYAHLSVDGDLDLASSGVPALVSLGGGYRAHTTMDMWLIEVGSQEQLWDRLVLGLAFGVMWTFDARTTITSVGGAPTSPVLGQAAQQAESALKAYGVVPTLTVRLGFDFI